MRLKCHEPSGAFVRRGQAQSMRDPGIAPIGADQDLRSESLLGRRISACQNPSRLISAKLTRLTALPNRHADPFRQAKEQIVKKTALETQAEKRTPVPRRKRHSR